MAAQSSTKLPGIVWALVAIEIANLSLNLAVSRNVMGAIGVGIMIHYVVKGAGRGSLIVLKLLTLVLLGVVYFNPTDPDPPELSGINLIVIGCYALLGVASIGLLASPQMGNWIRLKSAKPETAGSVTE